jgi:hypothetical protein
MVNLFPIRLVRLSLGRHARRACVSSRSLLSPEGGGGGGGGEGEGEGLSMETGRLGRSAN